MSQETETRGSAIVDLPRMNAAPADAPFTPPPGHRPDPIPACSASLEWNLTNHTPDAAQIVKIEQVRLHARLLGGVIETLPPSRERSLAITSLEESTMWAVAGIARGQEGRPS